MTLDAGVPTDAPEELHPNAFDDETWMEMLSRSIHDDETAAWRRVSLRQRERPTIGYSEAEMRALYGDR